MSWKDYSGEEGYHRMIGELRASVRDQFPETQGRVYIFDQLNDTGDELASAAKALGMSQESLNTKVLDYFTSHHTDITGFPDQMPGGFTLPVTREDGTEVYLALGRNPTPYKDELTPETINVLAWHNLHEATHGIYFTQEGYRFDALKTRDEKEAYAHYSESLAETTSHTALFQHGVSPASSYESAATYDFDQSDPDHNATYDPAAPMLGAIGKAPVYANELESYYLPHLRESYDFARHEIRQMTPRETSDRRCGQHALQNAASAASTDEELNAQMNRYRYILPDAPRILASNRYLWDQSTDEPHVSPYVSPPSESGTIWQSIARAGLLAQTTHAPADVEVFSDLLSCTATTERRYNHSSLVIGPDQASHLLENPKWEALAQRMLAGETPDGFLQELESMSVESSGSPPRIMRPPSSSQSR